jgi:putative heme transporter
VPSGSGRRARILLRRSWPVLRWVFSIGLLVLGLEVLSGHRSELSGFGYVLGHLRWWWLPPAVLVEAASLLAFAGVQYRLLGAGGLRAPVRPLIGVTLASQAITSSLPGGPALAAVYGFRWYRRMGADDTLAGWALVGSGVAAALSLALVAAAGVVLATEQGASLDLIPVVVGVLTVTVAVGALFVYERPLAVVVNWSVRTCHRLTGRPRGDLEAQIEQVVERVTVVRLHWRQIAAIVGWGLANWLFDCACFACSFLAVGVGIPWKGLLLAYGAGQLAANLPITPGGLGAVEGSITIALAYFGGAQAGTVDAVLVYRLISFWGVLVIGWLACGRGAWEVRRGRWPRHALATPVEIESPVPPTNRREPATAVATVPGEGEVGV